MKRCADRAWVAIWESGRIDCLSSANWYFDFVSPFAYLQLAQFDRLPGSLEIDYVPVLFAGLLEYWENKGPAEIPEKRRHTYRFCQWYGERHGIPFRFPPQRRPVP